MVIFHSYVKLPEGNCVLLLTKFGPLGVPYLETNPVGWMRWRDHPVYLQRNRELLHMKVS
jgi:hypothetical protein